ncbi:MAG: hypothetical protein ACRYGR_06685 [Janthinobacterium lividum]
MTFWPVTDLPTGILDALAEATKYTGGLMVIGGGVAFMVKQVVDAVERRRNEVHKTAQEKADRDLADREREEEERKFYDQRARAEIERLERERDAARTECQDSVSKREAAQRETAKARENWIFCLQEARRCQQLLQSTDRMSNGPPLHFEILPDPRAPTDLTDLLHPP